MVADLPSFVHERIRFRPKITIEPLDDSPEPATFLLVFEEQGPLGKRESFAEEDARQQDLHRSEADLQRTIRALEVTNQKLRDSEERTRALVEASSQMVWTTDADGNVVEDSPTWRQFTGQTQEEWLGRGWLDVLHPEDQEFTLQCWRKSVTSKRPYEVEYRVRRYDGEWRWTCAHGVPQFRADGTVSGWVGMNTDITEQKLREEKLRQNQQRLIENRRKLVRVLKESKASAAKLQVLFDQSFYFAGILNLDGSIAEVNETALAQTGFVRDEVIGRPFWETDWWSGDGEIQETVKAAVERAIRGENFRGELTYWVKDGSQRMVDFIVTPARDENGEVVFVVPTATDITERKQAEQREAELGKSLLDKERRLSMALKSGGMAAWEWSESRSIWDDRLYELLGLPRETIASTPQFFASVHPDDLDCLSEAWQVATQGLKSYHHEFRIVRPDGEIRWLAGVGECLFDESGKVARIYGLNWDITTRKVMEEKERRQAEFNQFLSETSAMLSSSLDYEATLDKVTNLCVPTLADWAFMDVIGTDEVVRRVSVAFPSADQADLAKQVAQFPARPNWPEHPPARGLMSLRGFVIPDFTEDMLVKSAQSSEHEQVIRKVDPKSFVVVPLVARDKSIGVLTLISCDSARTFGEEDLKVAEQLASRAAIAIDNARLFREAQSANSAKSEFLANMSHEIRSPMTAILGYTDLLSSQEQDTERLDYLQIIKRNGWFLLDIINDILDLSKIEADKMEIVHERISLRSFLNDIQSLMSLRANEKGLAFEFEIEGSIPERIKSDSKRLRQILINLIGNAIKFTAKGRVCLSVRYHSDQNRPQMQFDVIDTGIGITPAQQQRLFQSFAQGDASITQQYGGTGLGLVISQRLARLLGGHIRVSSEPGKGSTFTCIISVEPAESRDPVPQPADTPPANNPGSEESRPLSCSILVVDDQRDIRHLTNRLLSKAGAEVELAENGLQALENVQKRMKLGRPYDLILLDMQMPKMDGFQTVERLREIGFVGPIVALTADAMQGSKERCLEYGCDDFLTKPVDARSLIGMAFRYGDGEASS